MNNFGETQKCDYSNTHRPRENWYVYVEHTHDTISEEKKYEYSETHINQFANRGKLWTKWCETDNDKIFTYVMMDLVEDRQCGQKSCMVEWYSTNRPYD